MPTWPRPGCCKNRSHLLLLRYLASRVDRVSPLNVSGWIIIQQLRPPHLDVPSIRRPRSPPPPPPPPRAAFFRGKRSEKNTHSLLALPDTDLFIRSALVLSSSPSPTIHPSARFSPRRGGPSKKELGIVKYGDGEIDCGVKQL